MDIAYALSTFDYDSIFAANNKNLTKVSDPNYKPPQQTVIKDPANYSILPPAFQAAVANFIAMEKIIPAFQLGTFLNSFFY
jgi:hypothetical protein